MLDIIKYTSLELRKHDGQCVPCGPSFKGAKTSLVQLPLCTLEFRAPRHSPYRRLATEQYQLAPEKIYDLNDLSSMGTDLVPSDSWKKLRICSREWAFFGPWFTGYKGGVFFSIRALGLSDPVSAISFLYPTALETAVHGFMTSYRGHAVYDKKRLTPYYKGPVNWAPITNLPVPAVRFDIEDRYTSGSRDRYVFFPVAKDKLISICFNYRQNCAGRQEEKDSRISPKPMLDLIESVISSIRLIPSAELQSQIDEAKVNSLSDYAVSSECQPFKWPADVAKDGLTILDYRAGRYEK